MTRTLARPRLTGAVIAVATAMMLATLLPAS